MENLKKNIILFLKVGISLALFAWILHEVDLSETFEIVKTASIPLLAMAFAWMVLDRVFMSWRWHILLKAKCIDIPFLQIVKMYFLGSFSGNFLPSSVAPDAIRVYLASRYNYKTSDILSSVLTDRVLGLLSLALVGTFSFLYIFIARGEININGVFVIVILLVLILSAIFSEYLLKFISIGKVAKRIGISENGWLWRNVEKVYVSCNDYKNSPGAVLKTLVISFMVQGFSILSVYLISLSIDVQIPLAYLFVFIPIITILVMLPVSMGGIGVQEGSFVYLFMQLGITSQAALTVALLYRLLNIFVSLPGGLFFITNDIRPTGRLTETR